MVNETQILQECRLAASRMGATVFRNNTGKLQNAHGRWVEFGLCKGGSDLIGWTKDGRFLAMEVKLPGQKPRPDQVNFINAVRLAGGVGGIVFSSGDVEKLLDTL